MDYTNDFNGALPYAPEAEQAVLGAIIMDAECMNTVLEILPKAEYFHISTHRIIYKVMLSMFVNSRTIDIVTIIEALKAEKDFDDATGKTYLYQLAENCPAISNVANYAWLVREKYEVRQLIQVSKETIDEAGEGKYEPSELIDSAEQKIYDIRSGRNTKGLRRIDEIIMQTYDRLDALNSVENNDLKPIPSGIGSLDRVITGLNRSDMLLIAARPGVGKTSFALNIAKHVGLKARKKVAFFSLEMTNEQLVARLLSTEALVPSTKLRTGQLSAEEWQRIISAGDVLCKTEIYIDDTPGITVAEMKSKLRRLKGVDVVVVDYLQLMSSGRRNEGRVQEISEITRNMKVLAKELNVSLIMLSQLSRASEQRAEHRPMLSDLRDSGSIEQDADIVLFLYREAMYDRDAHTENPNADQNDCEVIIAKNRHGETNTVHLHWTGEYMRFTDIEKRYDKQS
ncbi:MAG: replicative DNA helicase [Oscillospiraceae bacterium]|jgi:replicative DNA helicase|nr:replicative DNA helicase [Oscillospiraceae bacterium]